MANRDAPFGFLPSWHFGGGVIRTHRFKIADDYATALFRGDPIVFDGSMQINIAAADDDLGGIFAGCEFTDDNGAFHYNSYWPAAQSIQTGSTAWGYVWMDPQIVFRCQGSSNVTTLGDAQVGALYDIELTHAGSTTTGRSGAEMGVAGDQLKLIRILAGDDAIGYRDSNGNQAFSTTGTNALCEVQIMNHTFAGTAAAVAD